MKNSEHVAEFNALICEGLAMSIESDAMKIRNREYELRNEYPVYNYDYFMRLADGVRAIAKKFRKLGGVKEGKS